MVVVVTLDPTGVPDDKKLACGSHAYSVRNRNTF